MTILRMNPYTVIFEGKTHTFKELCDAINFCNEKKIDHPERIYEQNGHPYIRKIFPTLMALKKNRTLQIKQSRQNNDR